MRALTILLAACLLLSWTHEARADVWGLQPPVPGRATALFDPLTTRYSAGHRGADLAATPGEAVVASDAGVVHFAGWVAGRPSISVTHDDGLRTTYTPAVASVSRGQAVGRGDVIGTVATDDHCRSACLHWGLTDGVDHFDPLGRASVPSIRLLPAGTRPAPSALLRGPGPAGRPPVPGRTSSRFGMRTHPITGVLKLHDGTDIAAPCGTAVTSPWAGRVVVAGLHSAYGYRVIVQHDGVRTAYAHMRKLEVGVGDALAAGQRLGSVGSTGLSTGCHLHWMAWRGGALVDPLTLLA